MKFVADWLHEAEHMYAEHRVTVEEANEALSEPEVWWGVNGWRANSTDRRIYREGTQP